MILHDFARAVAEHLFGWHYYDKHEPRLAYCACLRHETGAVANFFYRPPIDQRVRIRGEYPDNERGHRTDARYWGAVPWNGREPEITVSINRDPRAVAADFRRRFEPVYLPAWMQCQQAAMRRIVDHDKCDLLLDELAKLSGCASSHKPYSREQIVSMYERKGDGGWHGKASVAVLRGAITVDLQLDSLTPEQARAVMRVLAGVDALGK